MKDTRESNWFKSASIALILLLSVIIVLLTLQNRELKNSLRSTALAGEIDPLKPGERVGPFALTSLDGGLREFKYADPNVKHLFFVFSTTCPHCEKNLVAWKEIATRNKSGDCEIMGLSIHALEQTIKYANGKGANFYVAVVDTAFNRTYKISSVPQTILVDGSGKVEKSWVGELSPDDEQEIESLMSVSKALTN